MSNQVVSIIMVLGIVLTSQFAYATPEDVSDGIDRYPDFIPKEDWSVRYTQLLKQAIKEEYNIDNETLNNNLIVISVVKGIKSDGFAIPFNTEKRGKIHFVYKIDWALYNGVMKFDVQDDSGSEMTDQQIDESMKVNPYFSVFGIEHIISKEQAKNICPFTIFPKLRYPWYLEYNNIRFDNIFDEARNETIWNLTFVCQMPITNREATFSLQTGDFLYEREIGRIYSEAKGFDGGDISTTMISIVAILAIVALILIFVKRKK